MRNMSCPLIDFWELSPISTRVCFQRLFCPTAPFLCIFVDVAPTDAVFCHNIRKRAPIVAPILEHGSKILRYFPLFPPYMYAPVPCRRDPLRLPLTDVFPFRLRYIGKNLQHKIGDECAGQGFFLLICVKKRHVQHDDIDLFFLCKKPPVLDDPRYNSAQIYRWKGSQSCLTCASA